MAYRRRQQQEQQLQQHSSRRPSPISVGEDDQESSPSSSSSSSSSLAAKAIRASSAHMESSLSSAYSPRSYAPSSAKNLRSSEYVAMRNSTEQKQGFWGALARKAKSIIDDNDVTQPSEPSGRANSQLPDKTVKSMERNPSQSHESQPKPESATIQKGLGAIASSLNYIGGTIGSAVEEGLTIVENRTVEIIHETRKHMKKKPGRFEENDKKYSQQDTSQSKNDSHVQTEQEIQLKASRDVAMAMAAKAKLLLRELKTVKADLAFAKERCAQLEDENKILRDNRERGSSPDDDDLIRLQLETLLAEKARLAHENSVYARENRFLREVVEYHQLTMQDVIYLDEASEEVNEVYPSKVPLVSNSNSSSSAVASASAGVYPVSPEPPSGIVYRT